MSAPVLLSHYRMKKNMKKASSHRVKKESETPVTLGFMREFRAEMMSRFLEIDSKFKQGDSKFEQIDARFKQIDARFEQIDARFEQIDARFDQLEAKVDQAIAEMRTMNHRVLLLMEEQNLRNKQAYDGYAIVYGAIQDLRNQLKPECFK